MRLEKANQTGLTLNFKNAIGKAEVTCSEHHGKTQYQKAGEIVMLYTRSKCQNENKRKQGANKQDLSS